MAQLSPDSTGLFYDRYALAFIPLAIALILSAGPVVRPRLATAILAVFAVVCLVGTRDHLEYNRAVWVAVDHLRSRGVSDSDIAGGWPVNGWLQYAHPENANLKQNGDVNVPWVNSKELLPYEISNSAKRGWQVLEAFAYRRWMGRSGSIFVLKKKSPTN